MACIQPGMVSSGAKALETNISGIITIIPANWTTSGRRSRSPISPNRALIAPANTTSTTTRRRRPLRCRGSETQSDGGDPEQRSPGEREDGLVDGASHPRQRRPHRQGREAVVQAVGVIDRGGDSGVGAGHDRGDGEHRRGEEDDVADPGRKARSCGDAAEHLTEQHQHRHRHGQREHQQLRNAGAGAQVPDGECGELVPDRGTPDRRGGVVVVRMVVIGGLRGCGRGG